MAFDTIKALGTRPMPHSDNALRIQTPQAENALRKGLLEQILGYRDAYVRGAGELERKIGETADYYLGPTGIPERVGALGNLLDYTDAGDILAVGDANRAFASDPSVASGMNLVSTTAAAALPFVGAKMYADGVDVVGDAVRSGGDDIAQYLRGEDGGIRAYHGSPHDFDKFSTDNIGTGEGAQVYGHGLYFAENADVAKGYEKGLSSGQELIVNGKNLGRIPTNGVMSDAQMDLLESAVKETGLAQRSDNWIATSISQRVMDQKAIGRSLEDAQRAAIEGVVPGGYDNGNLTDALRDQIHEDARQIWEALPEVEYKNAGRLYEVEIDAEPEDFLDWDKPLSEQPSMIDKARNAVGIPDETVDYWRDALQDNLASEGPNGYSADRLDRVLDELIAYGGYGDEFGNNVFDELYEAAPSMGPEFVETVFNRYGNSIDPTDTGQQLYSILANHSAKTVDEQVAKLREAGIPGIRYLDQGSRGAGEGTSNYVVFDDNLISIIKKYGVAGAAAMLGMSAEELQAQGSNILRDDE